jgi:hypothetical protein
VNTVLAVVASGIEELELIQDFYYTEARYNYEDWRAIQHALDASCSLTSFYIFSYKEAPLSSLFIEHLFLSKTLVNFSMYVSSRDCEYSGESRGQVVYLLCVILHFV